MQRNTTNHRYLDALNRKVLVFDGAMGTNLQKMSLTAEQFGGEQYNGCNDYLVISCPEVVEKIHRSFLEVGVDVIETDTFRSNRLTLGEYGLAKQVIEINTAAAALARRLADEYSHVPSPQPSPEGRGGSLLLSGRGSEMRKDSWQVPSVPPAGSLPPTTPTSPTSASLNSPTFSANKPSVSSRAALTCCSSRHPRIS